MTFFRKKEMHKGNCPKYEYCYKFVLRIFIFLPWISFASNEKVNFNNDIPDPDPFPGAGGGIMIIGHCRVYA